MNPPLSFPFLVRLLICGCIGLAAGARVSAAAADLMPKADAEVVAKLLPEARVLDGGVRFVVRKEGTGPLIKKGDIVTALYAGKLLDGTIFNQKRSRSHSFRFEVGATPRQIIRGWEQSMPLMQSGGLYTIAIPSELAYAERGREGQVPPHATLIFEIEIVEVEPAPAK